MEHKKGPDPIKYRYIRIHFLDDEVEDERLFKVFHTDPKYIRVRQIKVKGGAEVEGKDHWVPWSSIRHLREADLP